MFPIPNFLSCQLSQGPGISQPGTNYLYNTNASGIKERGRKVLECRYGPFWDYITLNAKRKEGEEGKENNKIGGSNSSDVRQEGVGSWDFTNRRYRSVHFLS